VLSSVALALAGVVALAPAAVAPPDSCVVEEVTIEWGFKESFRSYLSGAIALGTWSTSGDVSYQTPLFTFSGGDGFISADGASGEIAFDGEFRFMGHGGILNTFLSNPRLQFVDEREAILFLDVAGDTMGGVSVEKLGIEFVRVTWPASAETVDSESGVYDIQGAQTVLTDLGSGAFGTYVSGEIFDPMSISLRVPGDCLENASLSWWWIPGGAVGLAILGGAIWAGVTRANRSRGPERP